jgi:hypothetical protein
MRRISHRLATISYVQRSLLICISLVLLGVAPALASSSEEQYESARPAAEDSPQARSLTVLEPNERMHQATGSGSLSSTRDRQSQRIIGPPVPYPTCRANQPCQTDWDCRDYVDGYIYVGHCEILGSQGYCFCP